MAEINGTAANDTLVGHWSDLNWIYGEAGDDVITGGDNDDWIYGGAAPAPGRARSSPGCLRTMSMRGG